MKIDDTNLIVPSLLFCVSTKPHIKGGDHGRVFIKVDLKLTWLSYLISSDKDDGILAQLLF